MNVLYDHQAFVRQRHGGVSRYFAELVRQLGGYTDTEVLIVAPLHINLHIHDLDGARVSGRFVGFAPPGISRVLDMIDRGLHDWHTRHYPPDIIHETYYSHRPVARKSHSRTVLTVYDMIHERFPQFFVNAGSMASRKQAALERADHIICISETTRQDLLELCDLDVDSVTTVHLGISVPGTPMRCTSPIDRPFLLYVGGRGGYKNFARLLVAYGACTALNSEFRLVCFGGRSPSSSELNVLKSAGLSTDSLIWMNGDDAQLAALYRHASALVYPSLYEGFGMPTLEAMAHDCPVVCSRGGSIPEVVGEAGEFFDADDAEAMAAAIEGVVHSPSRAAELREAGRRRLKGFSWQRCADATLDVYKSLIR
ncbi:MAG: glycosyltransferase family 1 protein [Planctomycetota bacterium]